MLKKKTKERVYLISMKNIYENRKRTFFEATTHIPIRWNAHCFMISRSRDHEKRYHGDSTRYFFLGTTGLKDFAFFLNDKMFHECFSIVCACMQISFNKETFKSHNQKIYITNIYLLYVAKKEREKNEDIFQVSIINQVSIKNILMFWNVLNYINCPVIFKS